MTYVSESLITIGVMNHKRSVYTEQIDSNILLSIHLFVPFLLCSSFLFVRIMGHYRIPNIEMRSIDEIQQADPARQASDGYGTTRML